MVTRLYLVSFIRWQVLMLLKQFDLEKVLAKAQESLPTGLNINIAQNANDFLFASIHEVIKTLIEAFILVFIVVYIFLQDMRSTLIPAIAIPVALVATFFVLKLIGFSVNLLTLSAMVLAIAIVVDDAIVVVEGFMPSWIRDKVFP